MGKDYVENVIENDDLYAYTTVLETLIADMKHFVSPELYADLKAVLSKMYDEMGSIECSELTNTVVIQRGYNITD